MIGDGEIHFDFIGKEGGFQLGGWNALKRV